MTGDKILLVEDDLFLRELYRDTLISAQYNVLTAEDGQQGLNLALSNTDAKLMLLDLMLPKMHGIEVLKKIKADPNAKKLPVIVLTNLSESDIVQEALKEGAAAFLVKVKFTPQQIIDTVGQYIELKAEENS